MLFRHHRELLKDSMKTTMIINDIETLRRIIAESF